MSWDPVTNPLAIAGLAVVVTLLAAAPWVRKRNWRRFARRVWRWGEGQ